MKKDGWHLTIKSLIRKTSTTIIMTSECSHVLVTAERHVLMTSWHNILAKSACCHVTSWHQKTMFLWRQNATLSWNQIAVFPLRQNVKFTCQNITFSWRQCHVHVTSDCMFLFVTDTDITSSGLSSHHRCPHRAPLSSDRQRSNEDVQQCSVSLLQHALSHVHCSHAYSINM